MMKDDTIVLTLDDRNHTHELATQLASLVRVGDAILLNGEMGAGKSEFSRAFLRALSQNPALEVPSPTFTLVQEYATSLGPVSHFDLWRMADPGELEELGWDEACEGIVLVEWAEKLAEFTPPDALQVTLYIGDGEKRRVEINGWGGRLDYLGHALRVT